MSMLLVVLVIALGTTAGALVYVVVSPRYKLTLVTELGLALAGMSMLGIALATVERRLAIDAGAQAGHNHASDGWMLLLLVVGLIVAIAGTRRHRDRRSTSIF